jgi:hypothetical protein
MAIRKVINVGGGNSAFPFEVDTVTAEDGSTKFIVNPRSVIYKSFNLKDIMIAPSLLDKETEELIKAKEGNTDRHIIQYLGTELEAIVDSIIYIQLEVSANLNVIKAEIKTGPQEHKSAPKQDSPPWQGFPEMIGFQPPLEFDDQGQLKNSTVTRYQKYAYIPIANVTSDSSAGKLIYIYNSQTKQTTAQYLVQLLNTNIIIQTFNYDGIPVAYPIPFFGGTYLYYDYTKV